MSSEEAKELIEHLEKNPSSLREWKVYADYLTEQGEDAGELAALDTEIHSIMQEMMKLHKKKKEALLVRARSQQDIERKFYQKYPALKESKRYGKSNNILPAHDDVSWSQGHIQRVGLYYNRITQSSGLGTLEQLCGLPETRFLRELCLSRSTSRKTKGTPLPLHLVLTHVAPFWGNIDRLELENVDIDERSIYVLGERFKNIKTFTHKCTYKNAAPLTDKNFRDLLQAMNGLKYVKLHGASVSTGGLRPIIESDLVYVKLRAHAKNFSKIALSRFLQAYKKDNEGPFVLDLRHFLRAGQKNYTCPFELRSFPWQDDPTIGISTVYNQDREPEESKSQIDHLSRPPRALIRDYW